MAIDVSLSFEGIPSARQEAFRKALEREVLRIGGSLTWNPQQAENKTEGELPPGTVFRTENGNLFMVTAYKSGGELLQAYLGNTETYRSEIQGFSECRPESVVEVICRVPADKLWVEK